MSEHNRGFNERLKVLLGKSVEVLLQDGRVLKGTLLVVEENGFNICLSTVEGSFFINGSHVVAIKKGVKPSE